MYCVTSIRQNLLLRKWKARSPEPHIVETVPCCVTGSPVVHIAALLSRKAGRFMSGWLSAPPLITDPKVRGCRRTDSRTSTSICRGWSRYARRQLPYAPRPQWLPTSMLLSHWYRLARPSLPALSLIFFVRLVISPERVAFSFIMHLGCPPVRQIERERARWNRIDVRNKLGASNAAIWGSIMGAHIP